MQYILTEEEYNSLIDKKKDIVELVVTECMRVINGDIDFQLNKGILTNVIGLNQAKSLISHHFEVKLTKESVPLRD